MRPDAQARQLLFNEEPTSDSRANHSVPPVAGSDFSLMIDRYSFQDADLLVSFLIEA